MSDFAKVRRALIEIIDHFQSRGLLNKLGLAQERKIKQRTRKGIDLDGNRFKTYNPKYAARKERVTGIPTHVVNLTFDDISGMMQKIDHVVASDLRSVEIQITDPRKRQIASYHNQLGAGKSRIIRKFWGINDQDQRDFLDIVEHDLNVLMQKLDES